ncbi:hypothetical protein BKA62DRAFT_701927 [Auriculariales sp. MPI-PUGE-AT-0066]|nr:hypothetical protein BKA62DRAFT_701927 [Auriculariales sp. MPI-PUGE-AT-0066]
MVAPYVGHDSKLLYFTLAPWMLGCFLDLLTQGILFCQFNTYVTWYKGDKWLMRAIVYVLIIINILKCLDSCLGVWVMFVDYFGDLECVPILVIYTGWFLSGCGASINFYAQIYFLYRLFVISERHWVCYPVTLVVFFAWLAVIVAEVYINLQDFDPIEHWFAAHLSATFASDLLITSTTSFFLIRTKKHSLRQTHTLLDSLIRLTWSSAAPAAVLGLINLILSQVVAQEFLVSTIPNMVSPPRPSRRQPVSAIAMMWNINSRQMLRSVGASGRSGSNTGSTPISRGHPLARSGEVELSRIQVHKQTDTISHVDWKRDIDESTYDIKSSTGTLYGRAEVATVTEQSPRHDIGHAV